MINECNNLYALLKNQGRIGIEGSHKIGDIFKYVLKILRYLLEYNEHISLYSEYNDKYKDDNRDIYSQN